MNNEEKTKIGIDINDLDLTPVIDDKDNALINSKRKGGLYSSVDDKTINDGSINEKTVEVKLFPDITDNVSVKDNSSLPNDMDKLAEEGGADVFPDVETNVNSLVVKQEEDVNKPEKETEFNSKKMSNNINGASFIKYSILLFINLVFFWKVMIIFFSSYSSLLLYFIVNIICLIIYSIYFFRNIDKVSLRFLNYPLLLSLYCVFIFAGLDNIDNSLLNTIKYLIIDNELFLIGGACIIGLVLDFTKYHDDVEKGIIPFIKSKKDTNNLVAEEVAEESDIKSNLTSIFLFIFALLQFIVIPFIFRTTNFSEGLSIEYPYPIVKDLLYVGFIIFSFLVYFNYKNEGKNLRNFNIIFLLCVLIVGIINYASAIILIHLYILIFIDVKVKRTVKRIFLGYIVLLFIMGFIAMEGGAAFWLLFIPPLWVLFPVFVISGFLMGMSVLSGILFIFVCSLSIYLIIKNNNDKKC